MTTFVGFVGSGVCLVEADDVDHARWHIANQLGYGHKPWLTRDLNIRQLADGELEQFLARGARVAKAKKRPEGAETETKTERTRR